MFPLGRMRTFPQPPLFSPSESVRGDQHANLSLSGNDLSALQFFRVCGSGVSHRRPGNRCQQPIVFHKSGSVRESFDNTVLGKPGSQLTSYWAKLVFTGKAKAPEELASDAEVRAKVAATPGAIGYVDDGAVDASVTKVFDF